MDCSLEKYLNYLKNEKQASKHTSYSYLLDIKQFAGIILDAFVEECVVNWSDISSESICDYIAELQNLGCSKRSLNRKISALRAFYRFMERECIVERNPFFAVKLPEIVKPLPEYLSVDEVDRLLLAPSTYWSEALETGHAKSEANALLAESRDTAILEIIYSCGLRIGEVIGLNVGDLDTLGKLVRVNGKGIKERFCPLGRPAIRTIRKYLRIRNNWTSLSRPNSPVYLNKNGDRITPRSFQRFFKMYLSKAGLSLNYTPHNLRHSFASHLLDAGADLKSVQQLLGHACLSSTQIYADISVKRMKDIYNEAHPRAN
jgi:integrase/recombinase XerC